MFGLFHKHIWQQLPKGKEGGVGGAGNRRPPDKPCRAGQRQPACREEVFTRIGLAHQAQVTRPLAPTHASIAISFNQWSQTQNVHGSQREAAGTGEDQALSQSSG